MSGARYSSGLKLSPSSIIVERAFEGETIFVVINNSDSEQVIDVEEVQGSYTDLLSGKTFSEGDEISVPEKWGLILK